MKKETNKINRMDAICSCLILGILCILAFLLVFGEGLYKVTGYDLGAEHPAKDASTYAPIAWADLYPFDKEDSAGDRSITYTSPREESIRWLGAKKTTLETIAESCVFHIPSYKDIANAGVILGSCLSDPGVGGKYVRLDNGCWTFLQESGNTDEWIGWQLSAVTNLKTFLDRENTPFLYVQSAMKVCEIDPQLPPNAKDASNYNMNCVVDGLRDQGISCLDMRPELHKTFSNHAQVFFKTDHHWNVDAGIWAAGVIGEYLSQNFSIPFSADYCDPARYTRVIYPNAMFGSEGQGVTHFAASSEDYSVLFPDFETSFRLRIPDRGIDSTGSFRDLFVNEALLQRCMEQDGGYAYDAILCGNRPLIQITNLNNPDGPKILMVRDSYSIVATPYIALNCSELDLIDARRSNGNFNGSIRTYIKEMKPDIVMLFLSTPDTSYK